MIRILLVTFALILPSNLACHKVSHSDQHLDLARNTPEPIASTTPGPGNIASYISVQAEKNTIPPPAFRKTDFKNFAYPINLSFLKSGKKLIKLKDGEYQYYHHKSPGGGSVDFEDVNYLDVIGEGKKQAVVHLTLVSCGVSCDGGSDLFYFYSGQLNRLRLLWRIETGSLAYDCGLRSFAISKRAITIEAFRVCRLNGTSLETEPDEEQSEGKFVATKFTRFQFEVKGRKPVLKKREVLPNPQPDVRNYQARISIGNQ